jgi:membrane fusion protein (multidrug efflux system)
MKLRIFLAVITLIIVFAALAGIKALQIGSMIEAGAAMGPMPETVDLHPVESNQWEEYLTAVGTVTAIQGTTVRSEGEGIIEAIRFEPGSRVEAGAVLVLLTSDVESAQLEVAKARLKLAEATMRRVRDLHSRDNVSDAELDAAEADLSEAKATVLNLEAVLGEMTIMAPFGGQLGIREVSVGNYIGRGDPIVELQDFSKVTVDFSIPQQDLAFLKVGMQVELTTDAWPGETFVGSLSALNPYIDVATRSIGVQATFQNGDARLRPGMFVRVKVVKAEKREVTMVPKSSILNATFGDTVFVVQPAEGDQPFDTVRQEIVRLGETRGDFVEILTGPEPGAQVVKDGAFKLRDGAFITTSSMGTLEPSLEPTPPNS